MFVKFVIVCLFIIITTCYGEQCSWKEDKVCASGRVVDAMAAAKLNPGLNYGFATAKHLSKSTQGGIVDYGTGKWLIRADLPHGNVKAPHLNINSALTKMADPHIPVPEAVVAAAGSLNEAVRAVSDKVFYVSAAVNTIRLFTADEKVTVASSIAGSYAGGTAGAYAGSSAGGYIGGIIGSCFGGVGAIPGAAIGSMIGGLFGSYKGGEIGSMIAEDLTR